MMRRPIKRVLLLLLLTAMLSGIGCSMSDIEAYADGSRTMLAFTSDVHNQADDTSSNRLEGWIDAEQSQSNHEIDFMGLCGDMARADSSQITEDQYWSYAKVAMDMVDGKGFPDGVCYTTGNHELEHGKFYVTTNNAAIKDRFRVNEAAADMADYRIYCLGTATISSNMYTDDQISALTSYLAGCDASKPIFILTHYPLHRYYGNYVDRKTDNADKVINVLNAAAEEGKTIVFLWGHNHTLSDAHYDQVYVPGDSLEYKRGSSATIEFIYAAAGCMSDTEYSGGSHSVRGKGLIVEIKADKTMTFRYSDADGNDVTEGGMLEIAPPGPFYTISFDKNDDHASGSMSAQKIPGGTTKKLRKNSFTRPCYIFDGWNTQSDGSGTSYADEASISITVDTTLYAQWAEGAHNWSFTGFTWTGNAANGYAAASADYVCGRDSSHKASVPAAITTKVTEPTCTANGKTTYTAAISAAVSKDGKAHYDTKEVAGDPMISHTLEHHPAVPATSNAAGSKEYWECSVCHKHFKDPAASREYGNNEWIEPATGGDVTPGGGGPGGNTSGGGGGDVGENPGGEDPGGDDTPEPPPEPAPAEKIDITALTIKVANAVYTGSAVEPAITFTGSDGVELQLVKDTDYTVTYADPAVAIGTHKLTITGMGSCTGTVEKSYKINPAGKAISRVSKGRKSFTVKWKKASKAEQKNLTGYQIRYSLKKNMKGARTRTIAKAGATKLKIKKLKAGKTYYVQLRTYMTIDGVKYVSAWSKAKKVKTK